METKRCYGCMALKQNSPICEHCGYDERRPNAPHQLPPGTLLQGKYLIGRVLGQGGFGITYLGQDIRLDIPVAIKEYYPTGMVVRENYLSHSVTVVTDESRDSRFAENRDRFLREARTLAKLQDVPEVVQVMNFFEENNTAYIVMGYVKGITLKEHMRRSGGRLTAREVFRLLEPVMAGLSQVHAQGLVHRDISPDNIMLQPNKRARLIDFGAAHAATAAGDKSTQAVLKHGFAPLEQYQSKGNLGPWTDVYAMCATIYHCITGIMPPNATDRIVGEDEFRWDALTGLTPGQLVALKQGLAPQYKQRIQTMEQLRRKLFDNIGVAPQPAPIPQPQHVSQPKRKPQTEPAEPSVSESGNVTLIREEQQEVPAGHTAPVVREQSVFTVARTPSRTAPVKREVPVDNAVHAESQKDEKIGLGIGKFIIIVGVLVLIAFLVMFLPSAPSPKVPPVDSPIETTADNTTNEANGSRVLMEHTNVFADVFRTGVTRSQIESITFLDLNTAEAPTNAADASQAQDGSVLAWVVPNGERYDLYLAAKGSIIAPEDCTDMFRSFTKIKRLDLSGFDTGNVTSMKGMFYRCSSLTELNVSGIDTGKVTSMASMFDSCSSLEELDVSGFDTGNVTSMDSMFASCSSLTKLDVSGFDTGNVTSMADMFYRCSSLEELDVSGFDTGNVTNMASMFESCSSLTELNVTGFDTGNVTDMASMFDSCSSLTELNVTGIDTGNVTNMASMFALCSDLEELDVSGFDTGNVTDMTTMFYGCSSLTELNVTGFDTSNVTEIHQMFCATYSLKNVDGNFDVRNAEHYDYFKFMDDGDTFNGRPWEELFQ